MGFTVTIVRHGQTEFNKNNLIHGSSNGTITEAGVQQAIAFGKAVENERYTRAYSSDLERCRDTAKHALAQLRTTAPEIVFDFRLREKDFGEWEGQPSRIMAKSLMEQRCEPVKLTAPGGETFEQLMARVTSFAEELFHLVDTTGLEEENVIVFSHGMTIQSVLRYLDSRRDIYDLGDYKFDRWANAANTAMTKLSVGKLRSGQDGKRKIEIQCVNDCSHLGGEAINHLKEYETKLKEHFKSYMRDVNAKEKL